MIITIVVGVKKFSSESVWLMCCIDSRMHTLLTLPDQNFHSPYCQSCNSYDVSSDNLVLDQLIIPKLIFFFILITYQVVVALIF